MVSRTDLALENAQAIRLDKTKSFDGIQQTEYEEAGCLVTQIVVEKEVTSKQLGKPMGEYVTIETLGNQGLDAHPENLDGQVGIISKEINRLCDTNGDVLIIGLGNNDITPDALGPMVASQIFATRHISELVPDGHELSTLRSVSVVAPGVLGQTGIEVAEITRAICDKIKPAVVVVIDALACSELSHLGRTIQITNTGISPGSGVQNSRKELSQATLNTPVIAIGVPTVVDMQTIAQSITNQSYERSEYAEMMVTPRSIDKLIERTAKLISLGINKAFQPDLTIEEITSLV